MVEIHGKWAGLSNADSNHFGKLGCTHERICMEKNWKSEEIVRKCEGFIEKNEEIHMEKVKNLTERGNNLYGKESV